MVLTQKQIQHEGEIACGSVQLKIRAVIQKIATELRIKGEGKEEKKLFLGRV